MTDTAAKLRLIFYSAALMGIGLYEIFNPLDCFNLGADPILMLASMGIFILIAVEYATAYTDNQTDLASAFEGYSQVYEIEADENI